MSKNESEFAKIIAKAWRDPAFKAAPLANPAAALKAEATGFACDELSEDDLEAVAGGTNNKYRYCTSPSCKTCAGK